LSKFIFAILSAGGGIAGSSARGTGRPPVDKKIPPGKLAAPARVLPEVSVAVAINERRVQWVDCCKGICIVLVVYGHVAGGLEASGVLKVGSVFSGLRDWVYVFHIPAFFFLSGLFALKACERPFVPFLRGRLRVLFYPYLLWTAIIVASQLAVASAVNTPASASRVARCLWEPYGVGLWFLYCLFLVSLLFYGVRRMRLPTAAILLVGVVAYVVGHRDLLGFWYILNESMNYAIFFMIGGCFPGLIAPSFKDARRPLLAGAGVGFLALMTVSQIVQPDPTGLLKLTRALLGVSGVVCVAMVVARTVAMGPLALLGTYSLEIYLAHPLWGTASRAVLLRGGVHSPLVFVVCGVSFGIAGSLAMALFCKRFGFPYLFRWPARGRGAGDSGSSSDPAMLRQ
jgi:fucose 4-O-acetylase-like acetyltransferase